MLDSPFSSASLLAIQVRSAERQDGTVSSPYAEIATREKRVDVSFLLFVEVGRRYHLGQRSSGLLKRVGVPPSGKRHESGSVRLCV